MNPTFSKEKTVKRLAQGDFCAFDAIYDEYFDRLFGFVLKFLKQKEDAKEIVQEVFLKLWESRKKINVYASFDSYLFTIAYNTCISELKKRASQLKYKNYMLQVHQINEANEYIDETEYLDIVEQVKIIVDKLPPRQKEIFKLSKIEGLTYKEISEQLHISENTVKNHLVSALKYLRLKINNDVLIILLYIYLV